MRFPGEVLGQRVTLPLSFLIPKLEDDQINPFLLRTSEIIYFSTSQCIMSGTTAWISESFDFRSKMFTMLYIRSADGTWT